MKMRDETKIKHLLFLIDQMERERLTLLENLKRIQIAIRWNTKELRGLRKEGIDATNKD